jgi:hypothetical protein
VYQAPKSKKTNSKKKKPAAKTKEAAEPVKTNGNGQQTAVGVEEGDVDTEPSTPEVDSPAELANGVKDLGLSNGSNGKGTVIAGNNATVGFRPRNDDTREELDTMSRDRDALREEVAKLQATLMQAQATHQEELTTAQEKLEKSQDEKEEVETQYQTLLGKVGTIKAQLGERLRADAVSQS